MTRPNWDEYFLDLCVEVAKRSIDEDTQVGCVVVNEHKRIVSTGYNSFPQGVNDKFWPRARGNLVKVPKVNVAVMHGNRSSILANDLGWRDDGRFYDVDKYAVMAHAELNAIVAAGQDLHGCTLYCTLFPCASCSIAIITAGVERVVSRSIREDMTTAVSRELLIQAEVELCGPDVAGGEV